MAGQETKITVGFRCRVNNATGFEALGAMQKKAILGGVCPLEGNFSEMEIKNEPNTPQADREILAQLARCEVCDLKPKSQDIFY